MQNIYQDSIVIDGLNVSNWESEQALKGVYDGQVTAINATTAIFENYNQAMDNISGWYRRFHAHSDMLTHITSVQDIHDAKRDGKSGVIFGWQERSR